MEVFENDDVKCRGTGKNDLKTLRVGADLFENGGKKHFQKYPDMCGQAIK